MGRLGPFQRLEEEAINSEYAKEIQVATLGVNSYRQHRSAQGYQGVVWIMLRVCSVGSVGAGHNGMSSIYLWPPRHPHYWMYVFERSLEVHQENCLGLRRTG